MKLKIVFTLDFELWRNRSYAACRDLLSCLLSINWITRFFRQIPFCQHPSVSPSSGSSFWESDKSLQCTNHCTISFFLSWLNPHSVMENEGLDIQRNFHFASIVGFSHNIHSSSTVRLWSSWYRNLDFSSSKMIVLLIKKVLKWFFYKLHAFIK